MWVKDPFSSGVLEVWRCYKRLGLRAPSLCHRGAHQNNWFAHTGKNKGYYTYFIRITFFFFVTVAQFFQARTGCSHKDSPLHHQWERDRPIRRWLLELDRKLEQSKYEFLLSSASQHLNALFLSIARVLFVINLIKLYFISIYICLQSGEHFCFPQP
jgi:hypothetical protein